MKNIKNSYWTLLLVTILSFSSCEDFLNVPPVDSLSSDGFYLTPTESEQGVMGVYSLLRQLSSSEFRLLSEMRSDNVWVNPEPNGGSARDYCQIGTFRAQPNLSEINTVWNQWYRIIFNANKALEMIPDCDFGTNETFKNQLLGELYFLRGWAYFELVRLFGNIPIIDKTLSPDEVANVPQSTASEVYEIMVIPDLMKAKSMLPVEQDMKDVLGASISVAGRVHKLAATAMLGRTYMTMSGFPVNDASKKSLAKAELKEIIDYSEANGDKFWAPDSTEWRNQWMSEYNNRYSIFALQYRSGGTGNPAISEMSMEFPNTFTNYTPGISTEGWVELTLVYEFTREYAYTDDEGVERTRQDARGYGHTLYPPDFPAGCAPGWGASNAKEPTYEDVTVDGHTLTVVSNAYIYKYLNSRLKRTELGFAADIYAGMTSRSDYPVNYPVIRYEDVLLMYAEILASEGTNGDGTVNTTTALGIVNKIRVRAGCTPETNISKVMDFIKRERRVELAIEGVRWFDLIRWGDWRQTILDKFMRYNWPEGGNAANVREGCHLYPIPEAQNNVKPGFYKQNPGYSW